MGDQLFRQSRQLYELNQRLAMTEGQLAGCTILIEGFLHMGFLRRLYWSITGRFDRQWAVREIRKKYEESRRAQEPAARSEGV